MALMLDSEGSQAVIEHGGEEKIDIQVIAQGEGGENIVDFRMKGTSTFDKMMKAWCKHQGLSEPEAIFELNGRELKADDTPASCGWSRSDGTMKINAKPREEELPGSHEAQAPSEEAPCTREAVSSQSLSGGGEEKIDIQVMAQAEGGDNIVDFRMKGTSTFDKMMKAWCKHQGLSEAEAIFELNGRELKADDTPASCGWSRSDGTMKINAKPREEELPRSHEAQAPSEAQAPCTREAVSSQSLSGGGEEKIDIQVMAQAEGGDNIVDFRMKGTSTFDKMMKAWCKHQELSEAEAIFELNGRELKADDTPASCGWSRSDGTMKINAKPREEELPRSHEAQAPSEAQAPCTREAVSSQSLSGGGEEKIDIQVMAQGEGGENIVDFRMKGTSTFDKMMKAWCKHQGLSEAEAIFELNGRQLKADDTPASCGWSRSDGTMKINAKPREEELPRSHEAQAPSEAQAPCTREAVSSQSLSGGGEEKIDIQVMAQAEGGDHIVDFRMKGTSTFDKMMKAWCKHQGLSEAEAIFELNGRELKADDTPASCGWSRSDGTMKINAKPREEELSRSHEAQAPSEAQAPCTREAVSSQSLSGGGEEKIDIQVIAHGEGGENIVDFRMKGTSTFDKMMKAWCKHQGLSEAEAIFELNGRELKADDTPANCGWSRSDGTMKINAKPREEEMARSHEAQAPSEAQAPCRREAASSQSLSGGGEEKIDIQVIAQGEGGENIVDFRMKGTSTFDKMMKAWCKHQGLSEAEAIFELNGRELKAADTPASCGWSRSDGTMKINAKPREEELSGSHEAQAPSEAQAPCRREALSSQSLSGGGEEKIDIQVMAQAEGGENIVDFRMKGTSTFDKMMKAWCKHQGLKEAEAIFELNGRELKADDTPASCGWSRSDGTMKINAKPRDEPVPRSHEPASQISENPMLSAPTNTSTVFESGIAGEAPRPEKLEVHVTSEDVTPNLTVIKMRPSMAFEKMMAAWCKQHHFARTSVRFEFLDGRELNGEECPASDGHPIQVRAVAEPAEASKPKVTIAKDLDETQPTESEGESIDVRVIAEGEAGENILHFKMKLSTSFGKMMGRWCTHHGVPQSEACFRVGDQELKEADTPASIGWAFGQDFTVRAVPRALQSGRKRKNQEEKGTPKAKRATSAYYLFMKKRRPELTRDQPNLKLGEVTKAGLRVLQPSTKYGQALLACIMRDYRKS